MRVYEITHSLSMMLSNEEISFIEKHDSQILLNSLDDKGSWLARNLVRKGVYDIDKTNRFLVKRDDLKIDKS